MSNVFEKRLALKPFEYPEAEGFKLSIQNSYWLIGKFGKFESDKQDFHTKLTKEEKNAVKNSLLAISQIEVSVKKFWGKLGDRFPKPEFDQVGAVFAESEVRHADAYSKLLEVLGLQQEFDAVLEIAAIQGRVEYLTKYLSNASDNNNEKYTLTLALFALFVENVSLFSQFVVIKSLNKYKNVLKDVDNVVQATQQEEQVHADFGMYLINKIKTENPDWFDEEFYQKIYRACKKAYLAEEEIIDWIFEAGELEFLTKDLVKEFIKDRFNRSVIGIGGDPVFEVNEEMLNGLQWFEEELNAQTATDFFNKKPTTYSKGLQSFKEDDLFDD